MKFFTHYRFKYELNPFAIANDGVIAADQELTDGALRQISRSKRLAEVTLNGRGFLYRSWKAGETGRDGVKNTRLLIRYGKDRPNRPIRFTHETEGHGRGELEIVRLGVRLAEPMPRPSLAESLSRTPSRLPDIGAKYVIDRLEILSNPDDLGRNDRRLLAATQVAISYMLPHVPYRVVPQSLEL